ncbi:MAG: AAA family ATPase [Lachnospiraceae bacterium]|nr:AAA family ATPase [Lachnospiraceae bacterium]
MERATIDEWFAQGKIAELTERLEETLETDYEEYAMLKLGQCYLLSGDEKKAKKILRRLKRLFPSGEYYKEEEELLEAINSGNLLDVVGQTKRVKKKEVVIPESIKEYFENVVGLQSVQIELDAFYKLLRFQKERKESDFHADLLKSTHFIISGARGCGKTMVGEIIANLLYDFGVREESRPICTEARELVIAYENDKTGGISRLFETVTDRTIIVENIQDIFGNNNEEETSAKQLFVCLEKVLRERKEEISVILTGTSKAVEKMKIVNNMLEDTIHTCIEIPPYSTMELLQITEKLAEKKALFIHETGKKVLIRKIDLERRSPEFMNAISVNRYLDQAAVRMAQRFYEKTETTEADMVYLMASDFEMELEEESLEELITELDALTGLKNVKEQIRKRITSVLAEQEAQDAGAHRKGGHGSLHILFTGNPGTGKTTVARMLGKIYQQLGILPRGNHVVECTRSGLVGSYQGHTAKLVEERFKEAAGGVLFIDEAYALCRDAQDTFGHEAVDEIVAQMENHKDSMMVILAGYDKEMKEFLKNNSGFGSRFRNQIEFEDYTVEEMTKIFRGMAKGKNMQLNHDTADVLHQMLEVKSKIPDFGNARGVRNLFEEVVEAMDERLLRMRSMGMTLTQNQFDIICREDIEAVMDKKLDGEKSLDELLDQIKGLTGLSGAKQKVQEMVDDIQVKELMKAQGLQTEEQGTLHLVFKGNAGTGKTTVARLLGKIYTKLGILKKNVFVEVSRADLVANYSGQTATNVIRKLDEAEGGILFIDEVYTLINGKQDEFGKEAVNTLVAEIENRRDRLMVIIAGYGEETDAFLRENQGLGSRLSNEILFEDYTDEELRDIFCYMAEKRHMVLEDGVREAIQKQIGETRKKVKDFGNARGVRNILDRITLRKNSRIAAMQRRGETPTTEDFITIKKADIG